MIDINMFMAEFRMQEVIEVWKEESREEGFEEGIKVGREQGIEALAKLLQDGLPLDAALEKVRKQAQ